MPEKLAPIHRIACGLWLVLLAMVAQAQTLEGHVVCVSDGDSLTLVDAEQQAHDLRLAGIDAPERGQPFGTAARLALAQAVQGRAVRFEVQKRDRYGRAVGRLVVDDADVALSLVEQGLAWHYTRYAHEQSEEERRRYAEAELEARQAGRGLWSDPNPVPPWEWRSRH
ncbi:MAG: thermonuclease family protein [Thiobacillaceae bacterium]